MSQLTFELASQLVNSIDEFPVNFDELWQWCGYSSKSNAKRTLKSNFNENFDYIVHKGSLQTDESGCLLGSSPDVIVLTVDAAKEFGMLAQTEQGKEVRRYFINAEKECRKMLKNNNEANQILEIVKNLALNLEQQKKEFNCKLELILAEKSEKETLGELVGENFPKIPELLSYLDLEVLTEDDCYLYEEMYKTKISYSLKEICDLLRPHYKDETEKGCVFFKTRHNIGKIYKQLTGKELTRNYNYRFDKVNCLFALFVLDSTAKEIGNYKVFTKKAIEETRKELTIDDLLNCLD